MELRPIKTESDYNNALAEIERLFVGESCNRQNLKPSILNRHKTYSSYA